MTAIGTVSIDRTSLSLSALSIDTANSGTYTLAQGGLGRPGLTPRETRATASPFQNGQARTSVVWDESTLSLIVRVAGASSSALDTAVTALQTALGQFIYDVTVTVDGVAKVWTAYPATIASVDGLISHERVLGFYEDLAISIPVDPVAS